MSMYGKYAKGEVANPATDCSLDRGFTVQAERDDADINKIIARFEKTGAVPVNRGGVPFYGDVSDLDGLADSLIKIQQADELFNSFPASIRERFENDKVKFIEFLADTANRDEAIEMGLIQKAPVPEPEPPVEP